jgi:hypothetical protein
MFWLKCLLGVLIIIGPYYLKSVEFQLYVKMQKSGCNMNKFKGFKISLEKDKWLTKILWRWINVNNR